MMPPTILINHLLEPPNRISGISNYLFSLLAALLKRDEFRYVLATTWDREALPQALRSPKLSVRTLPFVGSMPLNVARQHVLLPRLMRETGAAAEFNCNPVGCSLPWWPRAIVTHDLYFDLMPQAYARRHVWWWHLLFPLAVRGAERIICVSDSTRRDLLRYHPSAEAKAVVVHEAGCLPPPGAPVLVRERYGLLVANISPNKNVAVVAEALALLAAQGRMVDVRHVGRDDAGLLADAQARAGGAALVKAVGNVERGLLSDMYARAAFFLCSSTHEGFCLPVIEAQAHGTPVIASDIPVLREVAGDGALFFDPHDASALATSIARLLDDQTLSASLSARSVANAARFTWDRAAAETAAVLHAMLDRRSAMSVAPTPA